MSAAAERASVRLTGDSVFKMQPESTTIESCYHDARQYKSFPLRYGGGVGITDSANKETQDAVLPIPMELKLEPRGAVTNDPAVVSSISLQQLETKRAQETNCALETSGAEQLNQRHTEAEVTTTTTTETAPLIMNLMRVLAEELAAHPHIPLPTSTIENEESEMRTVTGDDFFSTSTVMACPTAPSSTFSNHPSPDTACEQLLSATSSSEGVIMNGAVSATPTPFIGAVESIREHLANEGINFLEKEQRFSRKCLANEIIRFPADQQTTRECLLNEGLRFLENTTREHPVNDSICFLGKQQQIAREILASSDSGSGAYSSVAPDSVLGGVTRRAAQCALSAGLPSGIWYDKVENRYVVQCNETTACGRKRRRYFGIAKFGEQGARLRAIRERLDVLSRRQQGAIIGSNNIAPAEEREFPNTEIIGRLCTATMTNDFCEQVDNTTIASSTDRKMASQQQFALVPLPPQVVENNSDKNVKNEQIIKDLQHLVEKDDISRRLTEIVGLLAQLSGQQRSE